MLLCLFVFGSRYFYLPTSNPTNDPQVSAALLRDRIFASRVDACFFLPFILANVLLFDGGAAVDQCRHTAPSLMVISLVYVIQGYVYVFAPVILPLVLCILLPCVVLVARYQQPLDRLFFNNGASEQVINSLPLFTFRRQDSQESIASAISTIAPKKWFGFLRKKAFSEPVAAPPLSLPDDDAHCVICLADYAEGENLRQLECKHHFHVDV
jgi:hypothetical protein